jgi:hypothetical protein
MIINFHVSVICSGNQIFEFEAAGRKNIGLNRIDRTHGAINQPPQSVDSSVLTSR